MAKSIVLPVFLLMAISSAYALKCYNCDSQEHSFCSYGFLSLSFTSKECEASSGSGFLDAIASIVPMTCAKITGSDDEGHTYTARGCVPKGTSLACDIISKTLEFGGSKKIKELNCYTCDGDNCNSAGRLGSVTFLGLIAACFVFLF